MKLDQLKNGDLLKLKKPGTRFCGATLFRFERFDELPSIVAHLIKVPDGERITVTSAQLIRLFGLCSLKVKGGT